MPATILIVDDYAGFRAAARLLLEAGDFAVVGECADGERAVAEALRLAPDVVLLDVELPGIDGFEVARQIRARGCRTAVVLTSSRDRSDYGPLVEACLARGFVPKADLSAEAVRALLA